MHGAPFLETLSVCMYHSVQDDHHDGPCFPLFNDYTPRLWMMSGLCIPHLWGSRNGYSPSIDAFHCSCPDL
ncbi:hypothetical protein EDD16DRAFT_1664799 [Pisolithus croceorrhizus]|nr:hypothetical protein EDD16DRAFT_1664799 [Pisolithus croceorrhizus]